MSFPLRFTLRQAHQILLLQQESSVICQLQEDMSKRTVFTTITPLPQGITRETVIETLHNHFEMIEYVYLTFTLPRHDELYLYLVHQAELR